MNLDSCILIAGKCILFVGMLAMLLFLVTLTLAYIWKIYRNIIGWPLIKEAIREHRENHPEKYKMFDKTSLWP